MKSLLISLAAIFAVLAGSGVSEAQFGPRLYQRSYYTAPAPYYYGPPVYSSSAYVSPYGYQSYYNYGISPLGYSYYSSGTTVRPYVAAPTHSVYWDPLSNTYRYTTGYLNTPNYSYNSFYSYPYPY